jgi:CBS domain-containing protein
MKVRDLMTREVVTLNASETLGLADDIMQLGRIRHMPVLSNGRLVGVLSQRDLFRAAISSMLHLRRAAERRWLAEIPVRKAMSSSPITVKPDTSIREAVTIMAEKRIGCLPVVENEQLVGLLSESDCLQYLARLLDIAETREALPALAV